MSAIDVLCKIIAQGGKAWAASFLLERGYNALQKGGFLRETGVVQSIGCQECDTPHDAEVVFEGGQYGVFCPDLGFRPFARAQITAVEPDIPHLVAALADAFECIRRKNTPVHRATWRIGAVPSHGGDIVIYLHPKLVSEEDMHDLRAALSREVNSPYRLVLTAEGGLSYEDSKTATLGDVVEIDHDTGRISATSDPAAVFGIPTRRAGGSPNVYGKTLGSVIRSRIESGVALVGRNEEAKAILTLLHTENRKANLPSLPTIKRYLSKERGGSKLDQN